MNLTLKDLSGMDNTFVNLQSATAHKLASCRITEKAYL